MTIDRDKPDRVAALLVGIAISVGMVAAGDGLIRFIIWGVPALVSWLWSLG